MIFAQKADYHHIFGDILIVVDGVLPETDDVIADGEYHYANYGNYGTRTKNWMIVC